MPRANEVAYKINRILRFSPGEEQQPQQGTVENLEQAVKSFAESYAKGMAGKYKDSMTVGEIIFQIVREADGVEDIATLSITGSELFLTIPKAGT